MEVRAFAPGRINLIGEHTDYNRGLALPFAIAEGVTVRARGTAEGRILVRALDLDECDAFTLADPAQLTPAKPQNPPPPNGSSTNVAPETGAESPLWHRDAGA